MERVHVADDRLARFYICSSAAINELRGAKANGAPRIIEDIATDIKRYTNIIVLEETKFKQIRQITALLVMNSAVLDGFVVHITKDDFCYTVTSDITGGKTGQKGMRMNRKKKTAGKRPKRAKEGERLLDGHGLGTRKKRAVERAYAAEKGGERRNTEAER